MVKISIYTHLLSLKNFFIKSVFVTTETELKAMAAPAIIGLKRNPVKGYNTPAAIGIPNIYMRLPPLKTPVYPYLRSWSWVKKKCRV
jgi:hypothetical protein